MNTIFAILAFAAAEPSEADAPPRLLVLDLEANGAEDAIAKTLTGLVIAEVGRVVEGVEMLTARDVARAAELENTRALTGCEDDTGCLAEIAGALGAETVLYGDVGKLGTSYVVNLALLDARAVRSRGYRSVTLSDLDQAPRLLSIEVRALLGVSPAPPPPPSPLPVEVEPSSNGLLIASGAGLAVVGVVGLVVGGLPLSQWASTGDRLDALEAEFPSSLDEAKAVQLEHLAAAESFETWGQWTMAAGAVALGIGTAVLVVGWVQE